MRNIKVENMVSSMGNSMPDQFIIHVGDDTYFQSYSAVIARRRRGKVTLDRRFWNYSKTTSRYRNQFLGETTKETQAKIDSGVYKLGDLN